MNQYHQFLILVVSLLTISFSGHSQSNPGTEDVSGRYLEFDFWVGEWNVYKNGTDSIVGKSHIQSINDGKGLLENYEATGSAYTGKSLNTFNRATGKWEQYWIDNTGLVLKLEGSFEKDKMILEGTGASAGNRISWQALENGHVRQVWEVYDDSQQWRAVFDGIYKPR